MDLFIGMRKAGVSLDFLSPLGMEVECEEKLQEAVCYRPKAETGGLDLEGRKESEGLKLACLLHWLPFCLSAEHELGYQHRGGVWLEENIPLTYWRWGYIGRGHNTWPASELG